MVEYKVELSGEIGDDSEIINYKQIDLWAATCQIERAVGIAPIGLTQTGTTLRVEFNKELEKQEVELLNGLITDPEFGNYPKNAKKIYMGNIWTLRDTIEKALGKTILAVDFFEKQKDGTYATAIYLSGEDLTAEEKTDIKTSISTMVDSTSN